MLQKSAFYLWLVCLPPLFGQEGGAGFSFPMTLSAGAMYTHRLQTSNPSAEPIAAAFRTIFYPTLQLGQHWFASSSIQVSSSPYFYFEFNSATNRIRARVIQGLVGYTRSGLSNSVTIKAGQMISAFGSFPLRYDDDVNPLIDTPLSYGGNEYGLFPVTLYGLPGAQVEATLGPILFT